MASRDALGMKLHPVVRPMSVSNAHEQTSGAVAGFHQLPIIALWHLLLHQNTFKALHCLSMAWPCKREEVETSAWSPSKVTA